MTHLSYAKGPPGGTRKTQTILRLLSAILHATPARIHTKGKITKIKRAPDLDFQLKMNHWLKASPWLTGINPKDGDDGFFPTTSNDLKPEVVNSSRKYRVRVLVCAPSNNALDEIVLRLLSTGFYNKWYQSQVGPSSGVDGVPSLRPRLDGISGSRILAIVEGEAYGGLGLREDCWEENIILDRMNRYKVSKIEMLAQTERALEEAVLAGGDAANVVRDYEHKRQEMSVSIYFSIERYRKQSNARWIIRNRQVLAPRKNANNFKELKAKEKPPQIFKPRCCRIMGRNEDDLSAGK
ncbi:probable helicase MAGATAMA 3 [Tanacetum coccineum]